MRQRPQKKTLIHDLRQLLKFISCSRKRQLGSLLILMIISSLSEVISLGAVLPFLESFNRAEVLFNSEYLRPYLNFFNITTPTQMVTGLAVVFMASVLLCNGLRILTINKQTHLAASISSDISCQLYRRTMGQSYRFHIQQNSSDLIQLITGDTKSLANGILTPLLFLITNSCTVIALAIGLFLISWPVAIASTIVLGGAYIGLYRWRRKRLAANSQIIVQGSQQQIKIAQEGLGGIRDVLIGGTQGFFQASYEQADIDVRQMSANNMVIAQTPRYVIEGLTMMAIALLALMLGHNGDFSQVVPVLGGLALGANRLLPALQRVFASLVKIQSTRASLQRVLQGLQRSMPSRPTLPPEPKKPLRQDLRFENVCFRYEPSSRWILNNLNLNIPARTTVGFVGTTGSGKSTTADIILGLLQPQGGGVYVDGDLLLGDRLHEWQQTIAHVPQSIFLSDASIAENIAFGIPTDQIDIERVHQAAQLAQIDAYVRELPAQYETYVGERGVKLSGGQRQRIGIARALYRQASVIVFDEATSALDSSTEKEVMAAINGLSHHLTIVLIAHRLSTLKECDQIIEFDQGRVSAAGTYTELIERSGRFRDSHFQGAAFEQTLPTPVAECYAQRS